MFYVKQLPKVNEKLFIDTIKNLSVSRLEEIIKLKNNLLDICLSYFKEFDITLQG